MSLIIFFIVLGIIILVHELGHFLSAKLAGAKVEEFGLGFPPRLITWHYGETKYSLNLIPFGGFVSIQGELPEKISPDQSAELDASRSLINKSRPWQATVLAAGCWFNLLLAYILFTIGLFIGLPTAFNPQDQNYLSRQVSEVAVRIYQVKPASPADQAQLKRGMIIKQLASDNGEIVLATELDEVINFINRHAEKNVYLTIKQSSGDNIIKVVPQKNSTGTGGEIGVGLEQSGILRLRSWTNLWWGAYLTIVMTKQVALELWHFFGQLFINQADWSQATGPVGLVALVGDMWSLGWAYLLSFTALISINLALINLIPFPALDGGRLLFLLIESISGKNLPAKWLNLINLLGFICLISLMLIITFFDLSALFS